MARRLLIRMTEMYKHHQRTPIRNTIITLFAIGFFIVGPLWLANWQIKQSFVPYSPIKHVDIIHLQEGKSTIKLLAAYGFDLRKIRQKKSGVPALYFANLPRELTKLKDTREKKRLFLSALLPPILKVNNIITQDRQRLKKIILKLTLGENATEAEYYWVTQKLVYYKIKVNDVQDFMDRMDVILDELLSRMNVIPPQLALAQAAQESGWGTSRFSQKGNALYGEWTWGNGCGMVPRQREPGKKHRMKCFPTIIEAVSSYIHNLNTHRAYQELRQVRRRFRDDQSMDVNALVETMTQYSQERDHYVTKIKNIIRVNRLNDFRRAYLQPV